MRILATILISTSLFPLLPDVALAGKPQKATAPLVRPDTPPDADASGNVKIRSQKAGEDRFGLKGKSLDTALTYEAFLEDAVGGGTFTSIGVMAVSTGDPDTVELKFDQKQGPLPLGAAGVAEFAGRIVQIQSSAQVYLQGPVPEFPAKKNSKGGAWQRGKACLTRIVTPPDEDAKGVVEVRTKAKANRDRFDVKIQRVPADTVTFSVFLDDGLGVMTDVGAMTQSIDDPEAARLKIDTKSGAPLPFGVYDVEDLAGRALEVRGNNGFTYLAGAVPDFHTGKKKAKAKAKLTGAGGSGELFLSSHAVAPYEKFELKVKTQVLSGTVDLYMEDPVGSVMTLVAQLQTNADGKASYKVSTKSGAPLPFNVDSLADLEALAIEIRDATPTVLMTGTVPAL